MIRIIVCGKIKEKWLSQGIDEYLKRCRAYDKIEIVEVKDSQAPQTNSDAQNEQVKNEEGRRLLGQIKDDEYVIALDLKGESLDSLQLAKQIQSLYDYGKSRIVFVIGGSLGLSQEVLQRSNQQLKISDNTFPHQLCRLILLEMIYRCFRINHNEPYHK